MDSSELLKSYDLFVASGDPQGELAQRIASFIESEDKFVYLFNSQCNGQGDDSHLRILARSEILVLDLDSVCDLTSLENIAREAYELYVPTICYTKKENSRDVGLGRIPPYLSEESLDPFVVDVSDLGKGLDRIVNAYLKISEKYDALKSSTFTTGEVADFFSVSQQVIISLFKKAQLTGFRVPGSDHRRITYNSILKSLDDAEKDPKNGSFDHVRRNLRHKFLF